MKFHLSDIPKMAVAAMATASIFMIDNYRPPVHQPAKSERISWETAQALRANYLLNDPIKIEYPGPGGARVTEPLEGFVMDAAAINEIMNNNQNGINGRRTADELIIYFGKEQVSGKMEFRIITAGVQNGVLLKSSDPRDVSKSSVFDRADPCPPNRIAITN